MTALLLLKASLLLSIALFAMRVLRDASASTRHRLWSFVFAAVLALPLLAFTLPAVHVPTPEAWTAMARWVALSSPAHEPSAEDALPHEPLTSIRRAIESTSNGASNPDGVIAADDHPSDVLTSAWTMRLMLLTAWLLGTAGAVAAVLVSLARVRRLARRADEVDDPGWKDAADVLSARVGLNGPPRLLLSSEVGTPMAGGIWKPLIFLPASARSWTDEQRDVVLAHEIVHLAGRDQLRHLATRLAVALYWFHPLAWISARQAVVAREQACDEAVLALGTRPSAYARVLLELAESMDPTVRAAALPMVERSLLERRLMAILKNDSRPVTRRTVAIPALGVAALTLAVAAAQPALPAALVDVPAAFQSGAPSAQSPGSSEPTSRTSAAWLMASGARQSDVGRDSACWWDGSDGRSFSGNISMSDSGGRAVIYEQVGTRGTDRVIQKSFGGLRLCMLAEDLGPQEDQGRPSQWLELSRRTVLEARQGGQVQRLEVARQGAVHQVSWRIGSSDRPFDAAAQQWRDRMLATLDAIWEISRLRGEVSSLQGEISSIRGEESSLRGEISSLQGEVSSMRGHASSVRGEESSLRGEISSIHGHVSSLNGAISAERGAISGLNGSRYQGDAALRDQIAASIRRHDAEIARIEEALRAYNAEAKIAAVEQRIAALDAPGKVAAIEADIRKFDLQGKVAAVERRIAELDVQGKVTAIERQIDALDVDRRVRQLEERRDAARKQLETTIKAIR
jgi:beta-lactamase regulating signal transducer with metallopeptidase domain